MKDNFRSEFGSELTPELFSILKLEEITSVELVRVFSTQNEQRLILNLTIGGLTYGCTLAVGAPYRVGQVMPLFEQKLRLVKHRFMERGIQMDTQVIRSNNEYSRFGRLTSNVLVQARRLITGSKTVINLGLLAGDYQD